MPAPPRSCTPTARSRSEQLEARLDQSLLLERVPDLHRRSLRRVGLVVGEPGGGEHRHAADAVAPRGGAEQHGEVAGALGAAEDQSLDGHRAEAEDVHERVVGVAVVEHRLAADRGHADRVAVARDARHDPFGDPARPRVVERTEAQRVHDRDRSGTHREDVAQDAADSGGRPLVPARSPRGGCGSRCGSPRRCRRRRRRRQRPPPGPPAPTAPRWGTAGGGSVSSCRSSARTTSPSTWPARGGSARGPGARGSSRTPRRSAPAPDGSRPRRVVPRGEVVRCRLHEPWPGRYSSRSVAGSAHPLNGTISIALNGAGRSDVNGPRSACGERRYGVGCVHGQVQANSDD